jgi:hypothetical protein
MKSWLVENKDGSVRVAAVEAETAKDAIALVEGATKATDMAAMEKAYWAQFRVKPELDSDEPSGEPEK